MKTITRRSLLSTVAVGGAAAALAACSTAQIATFESQLSSLYSDVQAGVQKIQGYIPSVDSIAETLAGLFGPTWQTAVTFGINLTNQVIASIEAALNNVPPATASAKLQRMGAAPGTLVTIGPVPGLTVNGSPVVIRGYR
jgi:phage-related protein